MFAIQAGEDPISGSNPRKSIDIKTQWYFLFTEFSSILVLAVTKRKPARFSATKAVKANARDRVGQPKPARVVDDKPRSGRQAKHKPKLQDVLQREE